MPNVPKIKVYFNSVGVLTTYNIDLPNTLCSGGINMCVDAEGNLSRFMLSREKLLRNYRPSLRFVSLISKLIPEKCLHNYLKHFDLLHLNSASKFEQRIMKISEKPKIFVLHRAPLSESLYEKILSYIDVFVAPSEYAARSEAPKIGYNPLVIHNGVNVKIFNRSLSAVAARKALGVPVNAKIVLWNDRLSPEKDLKTFLEAIPLITKEVPNVYFYLKGRAIDRNYFEGIKSLVERTKKQKNVKYHVGWIPHEQLPLLYRSADVFVRTSLRESFGLALIESMACGVPVVGSKCAALPEVLADAGSFFEPSNSYDLAEKIVLLFNDPDSMKELANIGLNRVDREFTYDKIAEKYGALYDSLAFKSGSVFV